MTAAQEIALGLHPLAIARGMENMDRAPYLLTKGRQGYRMGPAEIFDSLLLDGLVDAFSDQHSGWHTEDPVMAKGISRARQDASALRSQTRFATARGPGILPPKSCP